jgi:hypothetical protein
MYNNNREEHQGSKYQQGNYEDVSSQESQGQYIN